MFTKRSEAGRGMEGRDMSSGVRVKQPQTYVRIARAQRRIGNSIRLGAHMTCQTTQPSSLSDKAKERKCLDCFLVRWEARQRTVEHLDLPGNPAGAAVGIPICQMNGTCTSFRPFSLS